MYVVFDLETTGINSRENQIIEIGAVALGINFEVIDRFQTFVDLYKVLFIPDVISELTGITMNDTVDAPEVEDALESFFEFLEKHETKYLIAQNAKFDIEHLYSTILELDLDIELEKYGVIDTIALGKLLEKNNLMHFENHKLGTLAAGLGIDYDADAHHRADYDAELTAKVFENEVNLLGKKYSLASLEKNPNIYSTIKVLKSGNVDVKQKVIELNSY